jgi:hypothetical protein
MRRLLCLHIFLSGSATLSLLGCAKPIGTHEASINWDEPGTDHGVSYSSKTSPKKREWVDRCERATYFTSNCFFVVGAIYRPGRYPLLEHILARTAISMAGGRTHESVQRVRICRMDGVTEIGFDELMGDRGNTLYVREYDVIQLLPDALPTEMP